MLFVIVSSEFEFDEFSQTLESLLGIRREKRESLNMGGEYYRYNCIFSDIRLIIYEGKIAIICQWMNFPGELANELRERTPILLLSHLIKNGIDCKLYDDVEDQYI